MGSAAKNFREIKVFRQDGSGCTSFRLCWNRQQNFLDMARSERKFLDVGKSAAQDF